MDSEIRNDSEGSEEFDFNQAREAKRQQGRPDIDHLDDAVVVDENGKHKCLQHKGNRIIIERFATMLKDRPWLDTRSYIILSLDPETGDMSLLEEEFQHQAKSNFITGLSLGYRFKIPARKGAKKKIVAPVGEAPSASASTKPDVQKTSERRIYATKGVIHTRLKGLAYVPQGETQAQDGMRLLTTLVKGNLIVENVQLSWKETWVPNHDL